MTTIMSSVAWLFPPTSLDELSIPAMVGADTAASPLSLTTGLIIAAAVLLVFSGPVISAIILGGIGGAVTSDGLRADRRRRPENRPG